MERRATIRARPRQVHTVALILVATLGLSQCTVHHPKRASATMVLLPGPVARHSCPGLCAELIPNAYWPTFTALTDALVSITRTPGFARKVVAAGGSAPFRVRADAPQLDIQTTSSNPHDADETLTVVIDLLTKELAAQEKQSGAPPAALRLTLMTRSDA